MPADTTQAEQRFHCWLGNELAIYQGMILDNSAHSHYVLQICYGVDAPIVLEDADLGLHSGRLIIIPSNYKHRLLPNPGKVVYFYLDPLHAPPVRDLLVLPDYPEARILQAIETRSARIIFEAFPQAHQHSYDPRILQIARLLRHEPDEQLGDLAARIQMSTSRLRHIFKDELGLGTRRFRLWSRTIAAITAVAQGSSLVESALLAGFADQSHFNRTVRTAFGITPTQLLGNPHIDLILI